MRKSFQTVSRRGVLGSSDAASCNEPPSEVGMGPLSTSRESSRSQHQTVADRYVSVRVTGRLPERKPDPVRAGGGSRRPRLRVLPRGAAARVAVPGTQQDHRWSLRRRGRRRGPSEERRPHNGPPRRGVRTGRLGGTRADRGSGAPGLEQAPRRRGGRPLGRGGVGRNIRAGGIAVHCCGCDGGRAARPGLAAGG